MKIHLAEHYGLCFGVRDAIAQAEQLASQGPLTVLGELVHNPVVRERLAQRGVREGALDAESAPTPIVMVTAHGASDRKHTEWRNAGFQVADGTCPLVRHAHTQLGLLVTLGYFPIVIGKRGHVEVNGLTGDFPEACVVEIEDEIPPPASRAIRRDRADDTALGKGPCTCRSDPPRPSAERSALRRHRLPADEEPAERPAQTDR